MIGVWLSILLAIGFISIYAWQITEEGRQLADALAATELVLAREQQLSQLDGLAAAAAHELGTPLSTITVIAKELERAIEPGSPHADDVRAPARAGAALSRHSRQADRAVGERRALRPHAALRPDRGGGRSASRLRRRDRTSRFPPSPRRAGRRAQPGDPLRAGQSARECRRFRPRAGRRDRQLERRRRRRGRSTTTAPASRRRSWTGSANPMCAAAAAAGCTAARRTGLGLGFFIAKTLLERIRRHTRLRESRLPAAGAVITVRWGRADFERPLKAGAA